MDSQRNPFSQQGAVAVAVWPRATSWHALQYEHSGKGPPMTTATPTRTQTQPTFPTVRLRRLRRLPALRRMVQETWLRPDDFIYPLFVAHGRDLKEEITSMPGCYHFSPDTLAQEAHEVHALGIPAVLLFGLPAYKDPVGSDAYQRDGIVQQAVATIKDAVPDLIVITDVCLCEYT